MMIDCCRLSVSANGRSGRRDSRLSWDSFFC